MYAIFISKYSYFLVSTNTGLIFSREQTAIILPQITLSTKLLPQNDFLERMYSQRKRESLPYQRRDFNARNQRALYFPHSRHLHSPRLCNGQTTVRGSRGPYTYISALQTNRQQLLQKAEKICIRSREFRLSAF